jgi:hypothetical protein
MPTNSVRSKGNFVRSIFLFKILRGKEMMYWIQKFIIYHSYFIIPSNHLNPLQKVFPQLNTEGYRFLIDIDMIFSHFIHLHQIDDK